MKARSGRAIFLDFDGVLFNTVRETYTVTMIALGRCIRIEDIDFNSKHFERFNKFRYLVGPAWNYYYLFKYIDKDTKNYAINLTEGYKKSLDQSRSEEHQFFEKKFFQTRKQLRKIDYDNWLSLISPYSFVESVRELINEFRDQFFIITTRDQGSVLDLLRLCNLNIVSSNVFAKKEYASLSSKVNIIQYLINKYRIEESIFVDDMEEHLIASEAIEGLSTMQAKWGYVIPEKKEDNSVSLLKELEVFINGKNVWA